MHICESNMQTFLNLLWEALFNKKSMSAKEKLGLTFENEDRCTVIDYFFSYFITKYLCIFISFSEMLQLQYFSFC